MGEHKAQYELTRLIADIKDRKFKYIPRAKKPIDWSAYNEAQYYEINDFLNLTRQLIDELKLELGANIHRGDVGHPRISCFDKAKAILVQQYFQVSNRETAGLLLIFKEKLNIKEQVGYKAIERAYEDPYVLALFRLLLEKTNEPVIGRETKFAGDGTGIPTTIKHNYANDRGEPKQMKLYDRMICVIGTEYKLISAVEITEGEAHESPFVIPLVKQTHKLHKQIDVFAYDGAAYSGDNIDYIEGIGARPRVLPPINAVLRAQGSMAKKRMLMDMIKDTQRWLEDYHIRSNTESRNSVDKRIDTRPLLKKIECRRHFEAYSRAIKYNVRQLGYLSHLTDLNVRWLTKAC